MDGGSTDRTKEISEAGGASFFTRPPSEKANSETDTNFQFIKGFLKTDWIFWGYVDNIAPKGLLEKLVEVAGENKYKQVMIPLYTYLWGYTKNYAQKSYAPFLFHKDFIDFKNNHIHGIGRFTGSQEQVLVLPSQEKYALRHFSTYNQEKFVRAHMRYAHQEALEKFQRGEKFSVFKMLRGMIGYTYVFAKQGWKNGKIGLIVTLNYVFYRLMSYASLYEIENGITLDSVEENYSKKKEEILKDF